MVSEIVVINIDLGVSIDDMYEIINTKLKIYSTIKDLRIQKIKLLIIQ